MRVRHLDIMKILESFKQALEDEMDVYSDSDIFDLCASNKTHQDIFSSVQFFVRKEVFRSAPFPWE